MAHYYGYMYFSNPSIFNHYKRFVRDYMHYNDQIYCAAGKIVLALQEEGQKRGFELDNELGGGYSSLHVRRGDLQVSANTDIMLSISNDVFIFSCLFYLLVQRR